MVVLQVLPEGDYDFVMHGYLHNDPLRDLCTGLNWEDCQCYRNYLAWTNHMNNRAHAEFRLQQWSMLARRLVSEMPVVQEGSELQMIPWMLAALSLDRAWKIAAQGLENNDPHPWLDARATALMAFMYPPPPLPDLNGGGTDSEGSDG